MPNQPMERIRASLLGIVLASGITARVGGQVSAGPDTIVVASGGLALRALLWHPPGPGPFPAVMFNHGSYRGGDALEPDQSALGPVFASHGYVFLFLFRRGIGLSADQGTADGDLMARALVDSGQDGRNRVQLELLQHEELEEALAGLAFLRALPTVNPSGIAIVGHSFGGSLTLLMAARDTALRAAVVFGAAGHSWELSPALRTDLLAAVSRTRASLFFIHAANDYSTAPGEALVAEMQRVGKSARVKIYPAFGRTADQGHNFVFRSVATWELDLFTFLYQQLQE